MARIRIASRLGGAPRRPNYLRVFVLECPNPLDALEGRSEGPALAAIGKLIGHEVITFFVRSKRELKETCGYVASIDAGSGPDRPLCLHISAHGNSQGLGFGGDTVAWTELSEAITAFISPAMQHKGKRIIVLSACHADKQQLTTTIQKIIKSGNNVSPPKYLFCASGNVAWQNAAVGWTLFYHLLPDVNLDKKEAVQGVLNKIKSVGVAQFVYFRWDESKKRYLRFAAT